MAYFEEIDSRPQMIEGELLTESVENLSGKFGIQAKFSKFSQKQISFIDRRVSDAVGSQSVKHAPAGSRHSHLATQSEK